MAQFVQFVHLFNKTHEFKFILQLKIHYLVPTGIRISINNLKINLVMVKSIQILKFKQALKKAKACARRKKWNKWREFNKPQFIETPVVSCAVLQVLHFNTDNGFRKWSCYLISFKTLLEVPWSDDSTGQHIRGEWGVEGVGQQDKLELNLNVIHNYS